MGLSNMPVWLWFGLPTHPTLPHPTRLWEADFGVGVDQRSHTVNRWVWVLYL